MCEQRKALWRHLLRDKDADVTILFFSDCLRSWRHTVQSGCTATQLFLCVLCGSVWLRRWDFTESFPASCLPSWLMFQSLQEVFLRHVGNSFQRRQNTFNEPLIVQVVLIRDLLMFLFSSSCDWTPHFWLLFSYAARFPIITPWWRTCGMFSLWLKYVEKGPGLFPLLAFRLCLGTGLSHWGCAVLWGTDRTLDRSSVGAVIHGTAVPWR